MTPFADEDLAQALTGLLLQLERRIDLGAADEPELLERIADPHVHLSVIGARDAGLSCGRGVGEGSAPASVPSLRARPTVLR